VVLMLPLAFAAMVWPARRIWAVRLVELLVSLILSKFVIVAVLSLAGAALEAYSTDTSQLLTAMALLLLSTFSPWALMRLLPFTELAAGTAGMLRHEIPSARDRALAMTAAPTSEAAAGDVAMSLPARMRQQAADVDGASAADPSPTTRSSFGSAAPAPSGGPSGVEPTRDEFTGPESRPQPVGSAAQTDQTAAGSERLPGMDPIWQAQNGEWPEIKRLDPEFLSNGIDYSPPTDTTETEDQA
jgi:hypothetical protein